MFNLIWARNWKLISWTLKKQLSNWFELIWQNANMTNAQHDNSATEWLAKINEFDPMHSKRCHTFSGQGKIGFHWRAKHTLIKFFNNQTMHFCTDDILWRVYGMSNNNNNQKINNLNLLPLVETRWKNIKFEEASFSGKMHDYFSSNQCPINPINIAIDPTK